MKLNALDADDAEKMQALADDLHYFWRDVLPIMDSAVDSSSLHDVARLTCVVDNVIKQQAPAPPGGAVDSKVPNAFL